MGTGWRDSQQQMRGKWICSARFPRHRPHPGLHPLPQQRPLQIHLSNRARAKSHPRQRGSSLPQRSAWTRLPSAYLRPNWMNSPVPCPTTRWPILPSLSYVSSGAGWSALPDAEKAPARAVPQPWSVRLSNSPPNWAGQMETIMIAEKSSIALLPPKASEVGRRVPIRDRTPAAPRQRCCALRPHARSDRPGECRTRPCRYRPTGLVDGRRARQTSPWRWQSTAS
jgi:hypothetical protein